MLERLKKPLVNWSEREIEYQILPRPGLHCGKGHSTDRQHRKRTFGKERSATDLPILQVRHCEVSP